MRGRQVSRPVFEVDAVFRGCGFGACRAWGLGFRAYDGSAAFSGSWFSVEAESA